MRVIGTCYLLFAFFVAGPTPAQAANDDLIPQVVIEQQTVVVSGATPGGRLVLFAVVREPLRYAFRTSTVFNSAVADSSGAARFDLPRPVVPRAVYAVVDQESGKYTLATAEHPEVRFATFPAKALTKRDGEYAVLDLETQWVEAVVVRPKKGAWRLSSLDGAPLDIDGAPNGRTAMDPSKMTRFSGADETPGRIRPKDIVIIVDPSRMLVMATEVPE